MSNHIFNSLTSRFEILSGIEMIRMLCKVFSDITCHCKTDIGVDIDLTYSHLSGTAKLLLQALDPDGEALVVHGREGLCGKRKKEEIGVFSLRGGTVAGEHTVSFFGEDEILEITHKASSRKIFAAGALRAAEALTQKPAGRYSLEELLF